MRAILIYMLVLLFCGPGLSGKGFARDFSATDRLGSPSAVAISLMGEALQQRSNGRLTVSVIGNTSNPGEAFTVAALRAGNQDMARITLGQFQKSVPEALLPELPFLFQSTAQVRAMLDGEVGRKILDALSSNGLVALALYDGGPRSFFATRPIRAPKDLAGLSVRVEASEFRAALISALGGKPVQLPLNFAAAALESRLVDAVETTTGVYQSLGLFSAAHTFSRTEHSYVVSALVFSRKSWDSLSTEDQSLVSSAARESVAAHREELDRFSGSARGSFEAAGVQTVGDIDRAAFVAAVRPVYRRYATHPQILGMVRSLSAGTFP